jgi:hypothetical protein
MFTCYSRSFITGGEVHIDKDPGMTRLAEEARRLSMGSGLAPRRPSETANAVSTARSPRIPEKRASEGQWAPPPPRRPSAAAESTLGKRGSDRALPVGPRRPSADTYGLSHRSPRLSEKRASENGFARRQSEASSGRRPSEDSRRASSSHDGDGDRRMSEAGLRRGSLADVVLNDDTSSLMVGQFVWVDGKHPGRIAFIGQTHFAKGELAGVHLERPIGKNNGTVGGIMYFQCEPHRGIFSRLHRLTREPIIDEEDEYNEE